MVSLSLDYRWWKPEHLIWSTRGHCSIEEGRCFVKDIPENNECFLVWKRGAEDGRTMTIHYCASESSFILSIKVLYSPENIWINMCSGMLCSPKTESIWFFLVRWLHFPWIIFIISINRLGLRYYWTKRPLSSTHSSYWNPVKLGFSASAHHIVDAETKWI